MAHIFRMDSAFLSPARVNSLGYINTLVDIFDMRSCSAYHTNVIFQIFYWRLAVNYLTRLWKNKI